MKILCERLVERAAALRSSPDFEARHKRRTSDFTRKRKIGFTMTMLFLLNFIRKSLHLEVDGFYDALGKPMHERATTDAFIKAREKIKPSAFIELFEMSGEEALTSEAIPRTKGYRVFAIDGSHLLLQGTEDILRHVGPSQNDPNRAAARVSILCEVQTGLIIDATIGPLSEDERSMAMHHLERFFAGREPRDVVLFDRGYASKSLIDHFVINDAFFLMRMQRSFNRLIDNAPLGESIIALVCGKATHTLRVCKIPLPDGEIEMLLTNLPREDFSADDLFSLYGRRWGVETQYDTLKNKLELERFSGRKWDYILQDFFATMFLSNVVAASAGAAGEEMARREKGKCFKHPHAVSKNVLVGKLKNRLILALAAPTALGCRRRMHRIFKEASRAYDCVRPDRHVPRRSRKETHHKTSFPRKRAL